MKSIRIVHIFVALLLGVAQQQALAGSVSNGRGVYQDNCASCHGVQGRSSMPGAPHFKRGQGLMKPDGLLVDHLRRGKRACPSFIGVITENEMRDVVSFIRTLYP